MEKPRFYRNAEEHFQKEITKNEGYLIGTIGVLYGHYAIGSVWDIPMLIGAWIVVDITLTGLLEGKQMLRHPSKQVSEERGDSSSEV